MRLLDGTILMHGKSPYDPVKAHEYYIRTRQLTGRKLGTREKLTALDRSSATSSPFYTVVLNGETVRLTKEQLAEQRAYATKRVAQIKASLADLEAVLKVVVRHAKEKELQAKREAAKPDTAAEKADAARESAKYRDKHSQSLATKSRRAAAKETKPSTSTATRNPVADVEAKVSEIKDSLTAAVANQRALAGATRNR